MLHILCPIEFSNSSSFSTNYALRLAENHKDCTVTFYHSYFLTNVDEVTKDLHSDATDKMDQLITVYKNQFPQLDIQHIVNKEQLLDGIAKINAEQKVDFIVMGINNKDSISQKVFGSNTLAVVHQNKIPVLVIPNGTVFEPIDNVLIALPYKKNLQNLIPIEMMHSIFGQLNVSVKFATISHDADFSDINQILEEQKELMDAISDLNPTLFELEGGAVAQSLLDFSLESNTQWITTVAEEHNFWYKILSKSVSTELIYHSTQPIMIFPSKK